MDWVILHTVVYHSSTSTYMPNFIEIKDNFCGHTYVRKFETHFITLTQKSRPKTWRMYNTILTKYNLRSVTYLGNFKVRRLLMWLLGSSLFIKSLKLILVIQVLKIFFIILNTHKHMHSFLLVLHHIVQQNLWALTATGFYRSAAVLTSSRQINRWPHPSSPMTWYIADSLKLSSTRRKSQCIGRREGLDQH